MHEVKIYGDIVPFGGYDGVFSIEDLNNQLAKLEVTKGDNVIIGINTFGGDVDAGFSMYNIIRRFAKEKEVTISTRLDCYCASIGTVILLAGDKRIGNEFSSPFVHNAWTLAVGDSNELKKIYLDLENTSNRIAKFYSENANIDFETAKNLMQEETWIEPNKALEYGFFTELEENKVPSKAMYNLLKENNLLRKNNNLKINNKMTFKEKFKNLINEFLGNQNKILFDAENNEIDFFELEDNLSPKVGDKATYKGQTADGEVLMSTGETFVFDKGTLSEIKELVADDTEMASLKTENENLRAEIETLKANNLEASNKLNSQTIILNKFKELESEFEIDDKKEPSRNNNQQESAFSKAFKNLKK